MIQVIVHDEIAKQIRQANGQVELVDVHGNRVGVVRRPPNDDEVAFAKSRIGSKGQKLPIDEVIAKVEAL